MNNTEENKVTNSISTRYTEAASSKCAPIETAVSKTFIELHAKLQIIESDLMNKIEYAKNEKYLSLTDISTELTGNISRLNALIQIGQQILRKEHNLRQNVSVVMERMRNVITLPFYLVEDVDDSDLQFDCGGLLKNMEANFKIITNGSGGYKLVYRNDLPESYYLKMPEYPASDSSSQLSGITACSNSDVADVVVHRQPPKGIVKKLAKVNKPILPVNRNVLVANERMNVVVTHINNPSSIFIQLYSETNIIEKLHANIAAHIKNFLVKPCTAPIIGDLCIVKCVDNVKPLWCRGRIVDIFTDDSNQTKYELKFIDFGSKLKVNLTDLRTITLDLEKMPNMAYECKLYDLYPVGNDWDLKVSTLIAEILAGCDVLMVVKSVNGPLLDVDLILYPEDGEFSLRASLIFIGYGKPYDIEAPVIRNVFKKSARGLHFYFHQKEYAAGESINVIVSHVVDPHNIYVQFAILQDNIEKLQKSMHDYYNNKQKSNVYTPERNMPVAVKVSMPFGITWQRGLITDFTDGKGLITAMLVDYGKEVTVSWQYVKKLNEKFISLECQAIKVKMADIEPLHEEWDEDAITYFKKYILSEPLKLVVCNTNAHMEVALFECFSSVHVCLNAALVNERYALSTGEMSMKTEWPQQVEEEKVIQPEDTFTLDLLNTVQGSRMLDSDDDDDTDETEGYELVSVKVLFVESPDCIYVHLPSQTSMIVQLNDLHLALQEHCTNFHLDRKIEWNVSDLVIILHPTNNQYYRAIIRKAESNGKYLVFTRDYAEELTVSVNNIGRLPNEFHEQPLFAYRCHLDGICKLGNTWSLTARDFLREIFQNEKNIYLTRTGDTHKSKLSQPAIFWYRDLKIGGALERSKFKSYNINKKLVKYGLAILDRNWVPPTKIEKGIKLDLLPIKTPKSLKELAIVDWNILIDLENNSDEFIDPNDDPWRLMSPFLDTEFKAIATYVDENAVIFLHELACVPILKDMEKQMEENFINTLPDPEDTVWLVHQKCTVQYRQNKKWYRGIVQEILNDGAEIKVVMIDFGNVEIVLPHEIRKQIMFKTVPRVAKQVMMHNVFPKTGNYETSDLDKLHKLIVEREIGVKIRPSKEHMEIPFAIITLGNTNVNTTIVEISDNCTSFNTHKRKNIPSKPIRKYNPPDFRLGVIVEASPSPTLNLSIAGSSPASNVSIMGSPPPTGNLSAETDDEGVIIESDASVEEIKTARPASIASDIIKNYTIVDLPKEKRFPVTLVNVLDYNQIIFELITPKVANEQKFRDLLAHIDGNADDQPKLKEYTLGAPCVAKFFDDGTWYRAKIHNLDSWPTTISVLFVDFGNVEIVEKEHVRDIKTEWLEVPVEQYFALLDNLEIVEDNIVSVSEHMENYYGTKKTVEIVKYRPLTVRLFEADTNKLAYQALIDEGVLKLG